MAFEVTRNKPDAPGATVTVNERVYLDADGKATTDRAKAVRLFAPKGVTVSEARAVEVGLVDKEKPGKGKKTSGKASDE